jgi:excinuclease UvrABC helicase subunit UvrB
MCDKCQEESVLHRSQPSVIITRGAKGNTQFEVKCYADSMNEALNQAIAAYHRLSDLFPKEP